MNRSAVQDDLAFGWTSEPADRVEQCGLSAAGRAQETDQLTGVDLEIDLAQSFHAVLVAMADPADRDLGRSIALAGGGEIVLRS